MLEHVPCFFAFLEPCGFNLWFFYTRYGSMRFIWEAKLVADRHLSFNTYPLIVRMDQLIQASLLSNAPRKRAALSIQYMSFYAVNAIKPSAFTHFSWRNKRDQDHCVTYSCSDILFKTCDWIYKGSIFEIWHNGNKPGCFKAISSTYHQSISWETNATYLWI